MPARGERPRDALLPPCRLEGMGTRAYGEEAIVNHFRAVPLTGLDAADVVVSRSHVGIFAGKAALIAETYGHGIQRIWRLDPGDPLDAEPDIGVAFDTDLFQARRDVAFRREDHPEMQSDGFEIIEDIGYGLAHGREAGDAAPAWRVRPFLLRAFSDGTSGVALFAVHRLGPGAIRSAGFSFAAARFVLGEDRKQQPHLVRDRAGEKAVEKAQWLSRFP